MKKMKQNERKGVDKSNLEIDLIDAYHCFWGHTLSKAIESRNRNG